MLSSQKCHIDTGDNACPVHKQAYPVPQCHLDVVKCELDHLRHVVVFPSQGTSEWGLLTLIIPQKDDHVHWISGRHKLNKVIKCKVNPLPIIQYILH